MITPVFNTLRFIRQHPLASRRPIHAYLRYVRWQVESRLKRDVEIDWIGGARLVASKGMTGVTGNIYCGLHEFADMAFLLHLLRPDDAFFDVGANVGSYSVLASAVCGAYTLAVEPDPMTLDRLRRNVAINDIGSRVTLVECAVGAQEGLVPFTIGRDTTNQVVSGLGPTVLTREVRVLPLDTIAGDLEPVLIKIDVEGYEPHVVAGAARTLAKPSLQAILIETVDEEILSKFALLGFSKASYDPFTRGLDAPQSSSAEQKAGNSLFIRDVEFCRRRLETAPIFDLFGERV